MHELVHSVVPEVFEEEEQRDLCVQGVISDTFAEGGKDSVEGRTWGNICVQNDGNGTSQVFMPTMTARGWNR